MNEEQALWNIYQAVRRYHTMMELKRKRNSRLGLKSRRP